jgi:hypothetical protein
MASLVSLASAARRPSPADAPIADSAAAGKGRLPWQSARSTCRRYGAVTRARNGSESPLHGTPVPTGDKARMVICGADERPHGSFLILGFSFLHPVYTSGFLHQIQGAAPLAYRNGGVALERLRHLWPWSHSQLPIKAPPPILPGLSIIISST